MAEPRIKIVSGREQVQFSQRLIAVPLPPGLPLEEDEVFDELQHYTDVLLGREDPPVESPYLGLAEVATAYYARACEIDMLIRRGEHEGSIRRGSSYYKIRTGVLRTFIDMSKKMSDLGSRRLTQEQLITQQRIDSGEPWL